MKYHFFHISALNPQAGEAELNNFCARHRIAAVDKALVEDGASSFWTFCVGYLDGSQQAASKGRVDYREVLNEADFAIFVRLRNLRKKLAEREGVPAYALFTNEQLAEIVTRKVSSLTDLQAIDGVGEAKIKKYGETFLAVLANSIIDGSTRTVFCAAVAGTTTAGMRVQPSATTTRPTTGTTTLVSGLPELNMAPEGARLTRRISGPL